MVSSRAGSDPTTSDHTPDHSGREWLESLPLPTTASRVLIISRVGCCLCEQAEQVAAEVCGPRGIDVETVDVDTLDPDLRGAWTDHVPVTVVDGHLDSVWTLDPAHLADVLDHGREPGAAASDPARRSA